MVKLILVAILSATAAIGSEHAMDYADSGTVKSTEVIRSSPQDSIKIDLPTRSVQEPVIETCGSHAD